MPMDVKIFPDLCTGCGVCEILCPEMFEMTNSQVRLNRNRVPLHAEEFCLEAASICPSNAIIVREAEAWWEGALSVGSAASD